MRADGRIAEVMPDGTERQFPDKPMRPMTEAEIAAAAVADPDARPTTPKELGNARRVPRVTTLRRALGLTQREFAARYRILLGTLRDWEQGRTEPDQPARAYLTLIAHDPKGVRRALLAEAERIALARSNHSESRGEPIGSTGNGNDRYRRFRDFDQPTK
jgi:putative transcriptional regulator